MSGVRHKAPTRALVVSLYDAGWKPAEIQRLLEREGHPVPGRNTIWVWTHPDQARRSARQRAPRLRAVRAETAPLSWPGVRGPEWKMARARALRAAGVPVATVARVMTLDFPSDPVTVEQMRVALTVGAWPRQKAAA